MNIDIFSGDLEIINSGTAINYNQFDETLFNVKMSEDFNFSIALIFTQNKDEEREVTVKIENNTVKFLCNNFDNTLGTGLAAPTEIAQFKGKKVYFSFWVYTLGDSRCKKIDYTFYIEKWGVNMEGRLNENLSNSKILDNLSTPETFSKLNSDIQTKIINTTEKNIKNEAGLIGKLLGTNTQNAAMNIVFILCGIFILILVYEMVASYIVGKKIDLDLYSTITPIISLAIGYLFGRQ